MRMENGLMSGWTIVVMCGESVFGGEVVREWYVEGEKWEDEGKKDVGDRRVRCRK